MPTTWQRLLERLASGDPVVGVDDIRGWNKLEFGYAVDLAVLREAEAATWVLCDACPERHWSEVIRVAGGRRAFIACPQEGPVEVEPGRLRQWRIDAGRVAQLTANALGLSSPIEVLLRQHLWALGRRRLGGRYRDIFLGVGGGPAIAEVSSAIQSSVGHGSALLLMVGCSGNLDGLPTAHHAVDLASLSRMEGGQVIIDVEYLEDRFSDGVPSSRKSPRSIPAPAGAAWKDVSVIVFDSFLRIMLDGKAHEVEFSDIGMDQQAQPVELLKLFAAARGTIDATKLRSIVTGDSPIKTRILRLRQLLQELIDIDGDPLGYSKKAQTYTCQFEIRLDRDEGFRTPSGASWLDFSFDERVDGRIAVSVSEQRRFRAHGPQTQRGRPTAEVAQEVGPMVRTHSLEEMGLRGATGKLTEEGAIFIRLARRWQRPTPGQ